MYGNFSRDLSMIIKYNEMSGDGNNLVCVNVIEFYHIF